MSEQVIQLGEADEIVQRGLLTRLLMLSAKLSLVLSFVIGLSFAIVTGTQNIYSALESKYHQIAATVIERYVPVKVVREVIPVKEASLEALIDVVAAEQKVPSVALRAIVYKESSNGVALYRFEPKVFARMKGNDSEARMLSSSHGPAHVMGFNAEPRCGMKWHELYDTYKGLTCGAKILAQNLERHKKVSHAGERLRLAFRDYNGSGEDAERYAESAMAVMARFMIEKALT